MEYSPFDDNRSLEWRNTCVYDAVGGVWGRCRRVVGCYFYDTSNHAVKHLVSLVRVCRKVHFHEAKEIFKRFGWKWELW